MLTLEDHESTYLTELGKEKSLDDNAMQTIYFEHVVALGVGLQGKRAIHSSLIKIYPLYTLKPKMLYLHLPVFIFIF
jgi:hypothetical protein